MSHVYAEDPYRRDGLAAIIVNTIRGDGAKRTSNRRHVNESPGVRIPPTDEDCVRMPDRVPCVVVGMHMPESDDTDADRLHGTSSCVKQAPVDTHARREPP